MLRWISYFLSLALTTPLVAQDGAQLYTLYCSACHGTDGKGATGGQFPPLAGSPWVADEPDRAIKVILQGLHGPVEVDGQTYNLEMPPQGAMLPDDQIAAILTYVRSAWNNQAGKVNAAKVAAVRTATEGRKTPWTAEELLKLHPLPLERSALTGLISRSYSGEWLELPDFGTLTAANVEEEHDGILDVGDAPFEDNFALLWEGRFEAPEDAEYEFFLDADDAATVWIDGEQVVSIEGRGPMDGSRSVRGKLSLTKGGHPIRIGYLEMAGQQSLALGWRIDGERSYRWLSADRSRRGRRTASIPVAPEGGRPVLYRNFIQGTTPRTIGVGFPGGLNLAWSADNLAPAMIWTGAFIDGAPKWLERGTRPSPPAGENVSRLSTLRFLPDEARFRGYQLDDGGNPTFVITIGNQTLRDSWSTGTNSEGAPCLVRSLRLIGGTGAIRIPLGRHDRIESSPAPVNEDGRQISVLTPGRQSTHKYILPH